MQIGEVMSGGASSIVVVMRGWRAERLFTQSSYCLTVFPTDGHNYACFAQDPPNINITPLGCAKNVVKSPRRTKPLSHHLEIHPRTLSKCLGNPFSDLFPPLEQYYEHITAVLLCLCSARSGRNKRLPPFFSLF